MEPYVGFKDQAGCQQLTEAIKEALGWKMVMPFAPRVKTKSLARLFPCKWTKSQRREWKKSHYAVIGQGRCDFKTMAGSERHSKVIFPLKQLRWKGLESTGLVRIHAALSNTVCIKLFPGDDVPSWGVFCCFKENSLSTRFSLLVLLQEEASSSLLSHFSPHLFVFPFFRLGPRHGGTTAFRWALSDLSKCVYPVDIWLCKRQSSASMAGRRGWLRILFANWANLKITTAGSHLKCNRMNTDCL